MVYTTKVQKSGHIPEPGAPDDLVGVIKCILCVHAICIYGMLAQVLGINPTGTNFLYNALFFNKTSKLIKYLHEFWNLEVKNGERDELKVFNKGSIGKFWIGTIWNYLSDRAVNAAIRWFKWERKERCNYGWLQGRSYVWIPFWCHLYQNYVL